MHLFISVFLLFLHSNSLHEFHLSNTEVRYNEEESSIQITTRIFIDDLEEALGKLGHKSLFLCTEKEPENGDDLVEEYLRNNIRIYVDEKHYDFEYLGKEISDDLIAVWCYMEIYETIPQNRIEVENNVLLEDFDDQKNIVKIKLDSGERAMFILKNGENKGRIDL